ncbi:Methylcrotonyl-CoA carboxylase carboxyl transferase subunit [Alloactinosynnema sp. L-07]|nr:Methylcrotonyl-CoA carboxylase carboxyl transferase subunit [Alloactinosynnema sp. L-07]
MTVLRSLVDSSGGGFQADREAMLAKLAHLDGEHAKAVAGGGEKYVVRHRKRGKLLARERVELLLDQDSPCPRRRCSRCRNSHVHPVCVRSLRLDSDAVDTPIPGQRYGSHHRRLVA